MNQTPISQFPDYDSMDHMDLEDEIFAEYVDERPISDEPFTPPGSLYETDLRKGFHECFETLDEMKRFFLYVETLFPNFGKAYTFQWIDQDEWLIWFNAMTKTVCFCIKDVEFPRKHPVYRIKAHSNDNERVLYFINNVKTQYGLPHALMSSIHIIHDRIKTVVYSDKTENSLGKNGLLHFLLNYIVLHGKAEDAINTKPSYENEGQVSNVLLQYIYMNETLTISETKTVQERVDDFYEDNYTEVMRYTLHFYRATFPAQIKLVGCTEYKSTVYYHNPDLNTEERKIFSAEDLHGVFQGRQSVFVNFLDYFLYRFSYQYGCKIREKPSSPQNYVRYAFLYHPLILKLMPWILLDNYLYFTKKFCGRDGTKLQVKKLTDALEETEAVDAGGPTREFIEDVACNIFQYHEKKILLTSMSRICVNVYPTISMFSDSCRVPVFFQVYTEKDKLSTVSTIIDFFKFIEYHGTRIPRILNKGFFTLLHFSKDFRSTTFSLEDARGKDLLNLNEIVKRHISDSNPKHDSMSDTESDSDDEATYRIFLEIQEWINQYRSILCSIASSIDSSPSEQKISKVLSFYTRLITNPKDVSQCFLVDFKPRVFDDENELETFYTELLEVIEIMFVVNGWNPDRECTLRAMNGSLVASVDDDAVMHNYLVAASVLGKILKPSGKRKHLTPIDKNILNFMYRDLLSYLDSLYYPIVEFLYYFQKKCGAPYSGNRKNSMNYKFNFETLGNTIMCDTISREQIAASIILNDGLVKEEMTPLFLLKIEWLKEHIMDEATEELWVEKFLKAVTGSSFFIPGNEIKIQPVLFPRNAYYTSHTCFSQLDISPDVNECPGFSHEDPKRVFIQNLTDGLLMSTHHMLLA